MAGLAGGLGGVANLNGRGLVDGLVGSLTGQLQGMGQIDIAVSADSAGGLSGQVNGLDFSEITGSLGDISSLITPILSQIPGVGDVIRPITSVLELVEQITTGDLPGQIERLVSGLGAQIGGADAGLIDRLLAAARGLTTAPEGQALMSLLDSLLRLGGARLPEDAMRFPNALPAIESSVKILTGTMALTSVIVESERLCGIMATQLDGDLLRRHREGLLACFGTDAQPLAGFIAGLDPADPLGVDAAARMITACRVRLDDLVGALSAGMGFGEATLVYLNVDQVQREIEVAAGQLRGATTQPLERAMGSLSGLIHPLLNPDLSGLPEFSLDGLLSAVEARVEDIAAEIRGVDLSPVTEPISLGVGTVTGVLDTIGDVIEQITATVGGALDQVRQAIEALPIDAVIGAIQRALAPITTVLDGLRDLVGGVQAAVEDAVGVMMAALVEVERLVDEFKAALKAAFGEAREVFEGFDIDVVIGAIEDNIQAFADQLAKVQMAPYFDAASSAIGTAASVIDAIPFNLLPDSMKQDVDAAVRPVKQVDADAFADEIKGVLQIEDGEFGLRDEIVEGLAELQQQYEALLTAVRQYDPHAFVDELDAKLAELSTEIGRLTPDLALEPVQEALATFKSVVAGVDLRGLLAPVDGAFDEILAALDAINPAALLQPVEARIDAARDELTAAIKLAEWRPKLDETVEEIVSLIDLVDPRKIEPGLRDAIAEGRALLDTLPDTGLYGGLGAVLAQLMSGSGQRVYPWTFETVVGWLSGHGGTDALQRLATGIGEHLDRTLAAVEDTDLPALSVQLAPKVAAVRAAIGALPAGSLARTTLEPLVASLDVNAELTVVIGHRGRYLTALTAARSLSETLRRVGLSEIDATLGRLAGAFTPLRDLKELIGRITRRLGLPGLEEGLATALKNLLDVATPARLVGIVMPVFVALRGRLEALVDGVADPLRDAIAEIDRVIALIDITPLRERLDAVFQAARDPIAAARPSTLLADQLASFEALQATIADFDPLGAVIDGLEALQATVQRVLAKLKASDLLADPLAIYDHIMAELERVNLNGLLDPLLNQLDDLAKEVDQGLDKTVDAFQALQAALPDGPGSTGSASASISIG